jgi:hypothetical protein
MDEYWRSLMNLVCITFSIGGLVSGGIAFDAATKWQRLSHGFWSKLTSMTTLLSSFASIVHVWATYSWRVIGVPLFAQWDVFPITYIASGLTVIISSSIFISFHILCSHFASREISWRNTLHVRAQ